MQNRYIMRSLYILTLFAAVFLWRVPYIALVFLTITSILLLKITQWRYVRAYIFCAVFGSLGEIIAIWAGAWQYSKPQFAGIPIWLPLIWGSAAVLFMRLNIQFLVKKS